MTPATGDEFIRDFATRTKNYIAVKNGQYTDEEFEMEIPYKLLEEFFFAFADAIVDA